MGTDTETDVMLHGVEEKCSSGTSFGKQNRHYDRPNLNFLGLSGFSQLPVAESMFPYLLLNCSQYTQEFYNQNAN